MTFQLDTTGSVICTASVFPVGDQPMIMRWGDLDAFTQGYVEALFASFGGWLEVSPFVGMRRGPYQVGFSDLAPETLARIVADCERMRHVFGWLGPKAADGEPVAWMQEEGRSAWKYRQNGDLPNFPPLTVQLGDDGKVRFGETV